MSSTIGWLLSVTDYGIVPIAEGDFNYTEAAAGTLRDPRGRSKGRT